MLLDIIVGIATVIGTFIGALITFKSISKAKDEKKIQEDETWKKGIEIKLLNITNNCKIRESKTDGQYKELENRMLDHFEIIKDMKESVAPIQQIAQQVGIILGNIDHIKEIQETKYDFLVHRVDGNELRIGNLEQRINK